MHGSASDLDLAALQADPRRRLDGNPGGSLLDLGAGCLLALLHSAGDSVDAAVIELLGAAVERAEGHFDALVVAGAGQHFGTGVSLAQVYQHACAGDWTAIERGAAALQTTLQRLRAAAVPVVVAPFSYCLGASAELAMAAASCQVRLGARFGLVETSVGLIPAGGGCLRLLERWTAGIDRVPGADPFPFLLRALESVALAITTQGVEEARDWRYLLDRDGLSRRPESHLAEARARALGLAGSGYTPPAPVPLRARGEALAERLRERLGRWAERGLIDPYDAEVAGRVAVVLTGGEAPAGAALRPERVLELEREAFLALCREERTLGRIAAVIAGDARPKVTPG